MLRLNVEKFFCPQRISIRDKIKRMVAGTVSIPTS